MRISFVSELVEWNRLIFSVVLWTKWIENEFRKLWIKKIFWPKSNHSFRPDFGRYDQNRASGKSEIGSKTKIFKINFIISSAVVLRVECDIIVVCSSLEFRRFFFVVVPFVLCVCVLYFFYCVSIAQSWTNHVSLILEVVLKFGFIYTSNLKCK